VIQSIKSAQSWS